MKKNFDVMDKLFTDTQEIEEVSKVSEVQNVQNVQKVSDIVSESYEIAKKIGRPRKTAEEKVGGYKFTLSLNRELKYYLSNIAWQKRKTATDYLRELLERDREAYYSSCEKQGIDPERDWEDI